MPELTEEKKLKRANTWVWEAQWASRKWREDSWRACELYDGGESSWTQEDWNAAIDAGIDPITTNRVFPAVNKMIGNQILGRFEIIAKGRTSKDGEIAQVMSEGIKFVMDQCQGEFLISRAHADALIPGIGCISPCFDQDPRRERVTLRYKDWKVIGWDPYSSPWWTPEHTRYVYEQPWMDIEELQALFPEKSKEIEEAYTDMAGSARDKGTLGPLFDEAQLVEDEIRTLSSSDWIDAERKRIRPVQMWYPMNELSLFALFPDGRCFEIRKDMDPNQAFQIIQSSQQVLRAIVKKMKMMTFFGDSLMLQDVPSPYGHDQYPLVPFVGYVDRWGFPYGVPRQIAGQAEEVNKRRSMALAMLKKRRVTVEKDAVMGADQEHLDALYEEANKLDGFMVLAPGGMAKFKIDELAQLSPYQIQLLNQSEFEIRDITGADSPQFSTEQSQSGISKQFDISKAAMTVASLPDNLRRSMGLIGNQVMANIQRAWTYEKVLRVTDRLTGAERYITVNKPLGPGMEVRNDITQGKYDVVISEVPVTDTMREKNLDLLLKAIEKSPPQAVPTLLIASFEMSDLPNKEVLVEKLKPLMGISPEDEDQDPKQAKQKVIAELKAQQEQAAIRQQMEQQALLSELYKKRLENAKIEAQIREITGRTTDKAVDTEIKKDQHDIDVQQAVLDSIDQGMGIAERIQGLDHADRAAEREDRMGQETGGEE